MSTEKKEKSYKMQNIFESCNGILYTNGKMTTWNGDFKTKYGTLKAVFQRKVGTATPGSICGYCLN